MRTMDCGRSRMTPTYDGRRTAAQRDPHRLHHGQEEGEHNAQEVDHEPRREPDAARKDEGAQTESKAKRDEASNDNVVSESPETPRRRASLLDATRDPKLASCALPVKEKLNLRAAVRRWQTPPQGATERHTSARGPSETTPKQDSGKQPGCQGAPCPDPRPRPGGTPRRPLSAPTMVEDIWLPLTKPRWASCSTARATRSRGTFKGLRDEFLGGVAQGERPQPVRLHCKGQVNSNRALGMSTSQPHLQEGGTLLAANERLVHIIKKANPPSSTYAEHVVGHTIKIRRGAGRTRDQRRKLLEQEGRQLAIIERNVVDKRLARSLRHTRPASESRAPMSPDYLRTGIGVPYRVAGGVGD